MMSSRFSRQVPKTPAWNDSSEFASETLSVSAE